MLGLNRAAGSLALAWAVSVSLLLLGAPPACAQGQPAAASEGQVKAAYLFKFAGFVEWPEGSFERADSALVIGIAGADALADLLEAAVAGRNVGGHPITVRRLRRGDALAGVHMLYVGAGERAALADFLAGVRGQAVLTVSDAPDSITLGCMIAFVVTDSRLRFDVGMRQATGARLRISARMLAAAHRVQGAT